MQHSHTHVCPWWFIRAFDNPLRRVVQHPDEVLDGLVRPGDRCLDVGCGFGYFTIPMAQLVGDAGEVVAADVQPEMLAGVRRRAAKAGVAERIRLVQVEGSVLDVEGAFDFAFAFWMMHEVPDPEAMVRSIYDRMKLGGRFLLVEPKWHVREASFRREVALAETAGFVHVSDRRVSLSHAALLERPAD